MGKYTHVSIASEKVSWQSFQKVDEIVSVKFKMYILFDIIHSGDRFITQKYFYMPESINMLGQPLNSIVCSKLF